MTDPEARIEIWGLTGGIAAGKSLAARYFAQCGIPVVDADAIARELSRPGGEAAEAIEARFGTLDRAKLRERVFGDAQARAALEAILHPLIRAESERRIHSQAKPGLPVLYEAALLVETGRAQELAGLIVVTAPRDLRLDRLRKRDGLTAELAERILDAQASDESRAAAADELLTNDRDEAHLQRQIDSLIAKRGWHA